MFIFYAGQFIKDNMTPQRHTPEIAQGCGVLEKENEYKKSIFELFWNRLPEIKTTTDYFLPDYQAINCNHFMSINIDYSDYISLEEWEDIIKQRNK